MITIVGLQRLPDLSMKYRLSAMQSIHHLNCADSRRMENINDNSVNLIVTSPPYPMIAMWDEQFSAGDVEVAAALERNDGLQAWEAMHRQLDRTWQESARVLTEGGFMCVNIGDAARSLDGEFRMYANHSRIISSLHSLGLSMLPLILWRKQTNAPNKFMGSGMLPAGAYVTLEHEYVLIFRKGGKRSFQSEASRQKRRRSALLWEERNQWFSDVWDFKGSRQLHKGPRARSGAFPFELAYRLTHMYSVQEDVVLDPFAGTGTTLLAAMAGGRHSIGIELEPDFVEHTQERMFGEVEVLNDYTRARLQRHQEFIAKFAAEKGEPKHYNEFYRFPVVTSQERALQLPLLEEVVTEEVNAAQRRITAEHNWKRE